MLPLALVVLATLCWAAPPDVTQIDEILRSFSYPGVNFRRADALPMAPSSAGESRQSSHLKISQIQPLPGTDGHPSAAARFALSSKAQQRGFGNVSVVDQRATQYSVDVTIDGWPMKLLVDSASSDAWVREMIFSCDILVNSRPCGDPMGPGFPLGTFSGGVVGGQHFYISMNDGEVLSGRLGYVDVEIAGISVPRQEMGFADGGYWNGDGVTSGVLGLAYPSLTSAYFGDDFSSNRSEDLTSYSPLFTTMMTSGNVEPFSCLALDRNSSNGFLSFGELPPLNLSQRISADTDLIIADIAHKGSSGYELSYYTILPQGFQINTVEDYSQYLFIIDSSTTMSYMPPNIAQEVNSRFDPPAVYSWYYGSYFVPCDAIPPNFSVVIGGENFWINPQDMINTKLVDPLTGLCATTINNGDNGPFILGISFLTNVVVRFDVGASRIAFYSREFY